jgi:hypothetical protein
LSLDGAVVDNDGTSEGETGGEDLESQCIDDGPSVGVGRMRLSTRFEYDNTVRDLLGDETQPASHFPPENRSTAFENNASGRMREIPEGDGSMLDHTVVLWVSELATGNHSHQRMPFVTAGNPAGHFRTGRYLDFDGRTNNDLHVSLQNAFGIESQTFGDPEFCTGPLAGLTV